MVDADVQHADVDAQHANAPDDGVRCGAPGGGRPNDGPDDGRGGVRRGAADSERPRS